MKLINNNELINRLITNKLIQIYFVIYSTHIDLYSFISYSDKIFTSLCLTTYVFFF